MTDPAPTALTFREVDHAAFATALGMRLRGNGVAVTQHALTTFARALQIHPSHSISSLYWCARVTLVTRQRDLTTFDAVFAAVFQDATLGVDPPSRRTGQPPGQDQDALTRVRAPAKDMSDGAGLPWHTMPAAERSPGEVDADTVLHERLPSDLARLVDTPFGEIDREELTALGDWLERSLPRWPSRRTRRLAPHSRHGVVDLRRTITRAHRSGGDVAHLVHARPKTVPRRLVMLCDVSQSMEPYATAYLHLMRTLARSGRAETFAFSTSLTRLTAVLQHRSAQEAIDQASARVVDRFGGTRIATNLRGLMASRHGNNLRGAIAVIASDGWDTDPAEDLERAMARLHRRAHRTIWLNPRAGFPGFAPRVASMRAALPSCDAFLPAHTVRTLIEALDVIGEDQWARWPLSSRG